MTLGDLIKALREGRALKQKDLLKQIYTILKFSQSKISRLENDHDVPDFIEVCKIFELFNLNPSEIWEKIKDDPLYYKKYYIVEETKKRDLDYRI